MSNIPALAGLEDEEDLEALRLAALQSLKKINPLQDSQMLQTYSQQNIEHPSQFWQGKGFRNKKGKTFGMQYAGRGSRNFQGHFNNRVRSSNLISIPTVPEDSGLEEKSNIMPEKNPQKVDDGEKSQDSCSKFERYNNSDKSESESEEEADVLLSEEGSPRLKKSDSLEALMQELDNEIQGKMISEEKLKGKKSKRRKKEASETIPGKEDQEKSAPLEGNKTMKTNNAEVEIPGDHKEPQKSIGERNNQIQGGLETLARKRPRSKSPPHKKNFYNRRRQRNFIPQPQNFPVILPYGPDPVQFQSHRMPFNGQQFNPMFGPPGVMPNQGAQQFFENPLPPLIISTDSLPTPILAPLSPRSAAFVLENKAIIERRRRSPRRSYSRSSSRSPVRSLSPRRSPKWSVSPRRSPLRRLPPRKRSVTPKRKSISPRRKSISPRRLSPSRRKSLSPRRKSISPRRKSISPRRRSLTPRKRSLSPRSPNRRKSPSPKRKAVDLSSGKAPVRDRLGVKSRTDDKEKPKQTDENPKNDDKTLDPVLEARRRKFESNEIKIKEGIIRLRPKDEKSKEEKYVEPKEIKSNSSKPKEDRSQTDKMKEEKSEKPKHQKDEPGKDIRTEAFEAETRSTTPKPKENIVEVAPATTTTEDKQVDDSVPDEFKELEKLLLGDDLELDPKVEDIFSDEDSASDNEGRFKVKEGRERAKPRVISFTKLVNGEKREIKSEPLAKYAKNKQPRDRPSSRTRNSTIERKEKKTPSDESEKKKSVDKSVRAKSLGKQRISFRTERPPPTMDKRFERKIEIKIKNPSKYERSGKSKVINKSEMASSSSNVDRKVNMDDKDDDDSDDEDDDFKPEIIVDNGSDEEFSNANEGDLRAQLSKKRAEKLHKIPVDEVSSRLLKYALKGAVFKKSKKKSKDKDISSSDAKPPIHLRLGLGNPLELIAETRTKRKSRKRKNREILEQLEYDVLEK